MEWKERIAVVVKRQQDELRAVELCDALRARGQRVALVQGGAALPQRLVALVAQGARAVWSLQPDGWVLVADRSGALERLPVAKALARHS